MTIFEMISMGKVGPLGFSLLDVGVVDEVLMVSESMVGLLVSRELVAHGRYIRNTLGLMFLA
jgi:hypothetical protein